MTNKKSDFQLFCYSYITKLDRQFLCKSIAGFHFMVTVGDPLNGHAPLGDGQMYVELGMLEAIAIGGGMSVVLAVAWVVFSWTFRLPTNPPLVSFFMMAAPILVAIAFVQVAPFVLGPEEQGDSQDDTYVSDDCLDEFPSGPELLP